jgi:hypothetical protein
MAAESISPKLPFPTPNEFYDNTTQVLKEHGHLIASDPDPFTIPDGTEITGDYLRTKAHVYGKKLLDTWMGYRHDDIAIILNMAREQLTADAFNDFYKWTMLNVVRKTEEIAGFVEVTFGVDFREERTRQALKNPDGILVGKILENLKKLTERKFDRNVFAELTKPGGPRARLYEDFPDTIDKVCGPEGAEHTLIDKDGVKDAPYTRTPEDRNKVTLAFYYDAEKDKHIIQFTGPWHRVTWGETSVMQCVYETIHMHELETNKISYSDWLYGALLRCAKSVAITRLIQGLAKKRGGVVHPMNPALFTGRRTGGIEFLLLQNLFFADHFLQAGPAPAPVKRSLLESYPDPHATICLGTSSVTSWYKLNSIGLPCLSPAGTHAHELSMVLSIVFAPLDVNKYNLPLTQIVGHLMYLKLTWAKTGGLMAMLPDTLGTRAFMKAANAVLVDGVPFIRKFHTGRQDSGKHLKNFMMNMEMFNYTGMKMASEIDTIETLIEALYNEFDSFGAGGFFGDSVKVWGPNISSTSMAVKAVKVVCPSNGAAIDFAKLPYLDETNEDPSVIVGYPIKTGDPDELLDISLPSKLSLNPLLPEEKATAIKDRAIAVRKSAVNGMLMMGPDDLMGTSIPFELFFNMDTGIVPAGLAALY